MGKGEWITDSRKNVAVKSRTEKVSLGSIGNGDGFVCIGIGGVTNKLGVILNLLVGVIKV